LFTFGIESELQWSLFLTIAGFIIAAALEVAIHILHLSTIITLIFKLVAWNIIASRNLPRHLFVPFERAITNVDWLITKVKGAKSAIEVLGIMVFASMVDKARIETQRRNNFVVRLFCH
jgi:hypothetical protein